MAKMLGTSNETTIRLRNLPRLFSILAALVVVQDTRQLPLVAVAAQQVTTFVPSNLEPLPNKKLPVAERLAQLHKALEAARDPHDIILEIGEIADASSVPLLIEALAKFGTVPRDGLHGVIDTRVHALDALQAITNHDAGRNAEDWRPWYETNKDKTQQQWITQGFAEHGFPVSVPPDDAFVTALIQASDPKYQPHYLQTNALRALRTVPSQSLVRLAKTLSGSTERADRRGAVAALEKVDSDGRLGVLRDLTKDGDIEVAENSLRTLNEALRSHLPSITAETVWDIRLANGAVQVLNVLDAHSVVLAVGHAVSGFDLSTRKITWTYQTAGGVRSNAVRIGDRLYFVSNGVVLHCVSVNGKPVWAKPLTSNPDVITTGRTIVAASGRVFIPDDDFVYVATPGGQIQSYATGERVSSHLVHGRRRVFSAIHNGPLLVFDAPTQPPIRVNTGLKTAALSAAGNVVCVVSFGPTHQLQCLNQQTLQELWRADLPKETGGYTQLEQDGENVYDLAQGRALAFKISDGTRRWATNEFTGGAFFESVGRAALTRNFHFELEWRDSASGEIIGIWGEREHSFAGDAVLIGEAILVETRGRDQGDGLRLMRVPGTIAQLGEQDSRVSGVVTDVEGNPLEGAIISIVEPAGPSPVRADAAGRFELQNLSAGALTIRVTLPGFRPETRTVESARGTTEPMIVVLRLDVLIEGLFVKGDPRDALRQSTAVAHIRLDGFDPPWPCGTVVSAVHNATVLTVWQGAVPQKIQVFQDSAGTCYDSGRAVVGLNSVRATGSEYVVFLKGAGTKFNGIGNSGFAFEVVGGQVMTHGIFQLADTVSLGEFRSALERQRR